MNLELVDKIAKAVLYEGYMLYPYRPSSVKNQQRWNFGVVYPPSYAATQTGSDSDSMQTECLVQGAQSASIEVKVRFLQLIDRSTQEQDSWQEAVERDIDVPVNTLARLIERPLKHEFAFQPEREIEAARDGNSNPVVRQRELITGVIELCAKKMADDLAKVRVTICNTTPLAADPQTKREQALMRSLVSTHTILQIQGGELVSLLDPPETLRESASNCQNIGTYPVLVGEGRKNDVILSSPIILYDYPEIAPESAGDLFDGTEIDEILSLRIMTMTDEEKNEMRHSDERARRLLERTENLSTEQMMKLHGTLRELRPLEKNAG